MHTVSIHNSLSITEHVCVLLIFVQGQLKYCVENDIFFSICIIRNVWKGLTGRVIAADSICFPFMGQEAYLHIELQLNDSMLVSFQR